MTPSKICFTATLHRPATTGKPVSWTFLTLPKEASRKLPSRGQVSVAGTLNRVPFRATLEPDGRGGHWLKVDRKLRQAAGVQPTGSSASGEETASAGAARGGASGAGASGAGVSGVGVSGVGAASRAHPDNGVVTLEITPLAPHEVPEPKVPSDLRKALAAAPRSARDVWSDITPVARRDWIQWIVSAKQDETRRRRVNAACDMLAKGKRRPCCFDRSGMYARSLSCPVAAESPRPPAR